MSKTKGFTVDYHLPDGKSIQRHEHKLSDLKDFVNKYHIPRVVVHTTGDKWSGTAGDVDDLTRWPVVPESIDPKEEDCPVCFPKIKEAK